MSHLFEFVGQTNQMLLNLRHWLERAQAYEGDGYDASALLSARLFSDQYELRRQVILACDVAKLTAARLAERTAPRHDDTEQTFAELNQRIDDTRAFLDTFSEDDFENAGALLIRLPFNPERAMTGDDYVREFAQPNFYFHVTTAYALLRHNGIPLGKQDYIGRLTTQPAPN